MQIFVNGRFRSHKITGVQRYAHELTARLRLPVFQPANKLKGWRGHAWEQTVLPARALHGLLWSPCAAGPVVASRQVVTIHDLSPLDHPEWFSPAYSAWYRLLLPRLVGSARHLIAVSEYTKQRLINRLNVPSEKITVIYNGRDPKFAANSSSSDLPALPSPRYILSVGSLEPRKNLRTLLSAWASVLPELPADLWLVVVGSGDTAVYKAALSGTLPARTHLTGYVDDRQLVALYTHCLAFVYPSLYEGFGLPPLEAMSCGAPVLTSSVTSLPEVCGTAAIYADPLNPLDLASKLKLISTDSSLRLQLRERGFAQAQLFSWENAAQKTMNLLQSAAS